MLEAILFFLFRSLTSKSSLILLHQEAKNRGAFTEKNQLLQVSGLWSHLGLLIFFILTSSHFHICSSLFVAIFLFLFRFFFFHFDFFPIASSFILVLLYSSWFFSALLGSSLSFLVLLRPWFFSVLLGLSLSILVLLFWCWLLERKEAPRSKREFARKECPRVGQAINNEINVDAGPVNVSNLMRPGSKRSRNTATINSQDRIIY